MTYLHDLITISGLAAKVYAAYNDTPDYRHISEEVVALRVLIDKFAQQFKSTTISTSDDRDGHKVLKGCRDVLEHLDCLFEKYRRLASVNKRIVLGCVKLGKDDTTTLHVQLISAAGLLNGFVRRCEYMAVQAQLAALLGLCGTANSRIPITSIVCFAANTDTKTAYKQFCNDLYQIGVTEDMVQGKEDRILEILRSQSMVASSQIRGSNARDQDQVLDILGAAYKRFFQDLHHIGVTEEDMLLLPPKDKILEILRSRGILASNQSGGSNSGYKDESPSIQTLPSFRLTSQVDCFASSPEVGLMPKASSFMLEVTNKDSSVRQHLPASYPILELLLWKGSSLMKIGKDRTTSLHLAAESGYTGLMELLLGNPPSNPAALKGHTGVIELLFGRGEIEALDKDKNTALHLAAQGGHTAIVDLLLGNGASIDSLDKDMRTALHLSTWKGHTATVDLLLGKGASVEALDVYECTAMHFAVLMGHAAIVDLLLRKGALPNTQHNTDTALHVAARQGHTAVVDLLLRKGVSPHTWDSSSNTALHVSAWHGHTPIVDLLLGKGAASPNAMSYDRRTPLHDAASRGHTGVVKLLLEKGASREAENEAGMTALQMARSGEYWDSVRLLET